MKNGRRVERRSNFGGPVVQFYAAAYTYELNIGIIDIRRLFKNFWYAFGVAYDTARSTVYTYNGRIQNKDLQLSLKKHLLIVYIGSYSTSSIAILLNTTYSFRTTVAILRITLIQGSLWNKNFLTYHLYELSVYHSLGTVSLKHVVVIT